MRKFILLATVFLLVGQGSPAFSERYGAERSDMFFRDNSEMAIGTIQALGRNTIEVYDEEDRTVKRLIYQDYSQPFHKGDRVRIYYDPAGNRIQSIKKMTSLEYSRGGQNLGYTVKNEGK